MRIAQLNSERETTEYRSRTTRLAKWRELVALAQEQLAVNVGIPERIWFLGVIGQIGDMVFTFLAPYFVGCLDDCASN